MIGVGKMEKKNTGLFIFIVISVIIAVSIILGINFKKPKFVLRI